MSKPDGGKDSYTRDRMQKIGAMVDEEIPHKWGFVILVFPFDGQPGRLNYVSNTRQHDQVNKLIREFLDAGGVGGGDRHA